MSKKVSVIIPVYNDEKYLEQCVESVLHQTYKNLEIILVDDGSTDNTPEICEYYRENYSQVRVLYKKNGGVGSSRNAGLAMATGDYVLFVDDDDWIDIHHVEDLYNLMIKNDADIAAANCNQYREEDANYLYWIGKNDYFEKNYSIQDWFKLAYRSDFYVISVIFTVPWCKLYKRSLFKNIAYPEDVSPEDDLTTWKIYLLANKIAYENKNIYTHRLFKESITQTVDKTALFPIEAVEKRIAMLKMIGFDTKPEEEAYIWRLNVCKDNALKIGDYVKYRDAAQKLDILKKYHRI